MESWGTTIGCGDPVAGLIGGGERRRLGGSRRGEGMRRHRDLAGGSRARRDG
ncbi:MAG: hypothetical protein PHN90_07425 [Methanothrix sp.]|nr:hypothetical protein [Methanothrix sp.]NLX39775.1 hypothetical protein [Methanothrix sp.]HOI70215.1 hypothetical protein [Methanothrix sp.]HPY72531.1 hypothetical protein [Methanothrix sp.]HQA63002.1 hypothetical protein [Methanothrix sp.]